MGCGQQGLVRWQRRRRCQQRPALDQVVQRLVVAADLPRR